MHDTRIKMKDGRVFSGPLWNFRPKEGWMSIVVEDDAGVPEKVYFRDVESAVTAGQRVGINEDGTAKCVDQDELKRARENGWDGT